MKRDITSPIIETIRKQSEFTKKAEIDADRIDFFERVLKMVNSCHYKEFEGLKVSGVGVADSKATVSLIGADDTYYVELDGYQVKMYDLNKKVGMLFEKSEDNTITLNIYFPCGNDIIRITKDAKDNITLAVYTNVMSDRKNLNEYIPDFENKLNVRTVDDDGKHYYGTRYTSCITTRSWSLDDLRALGIKYYVYAHGVLDTLDCDIQKSR